MNLLSRIQLCYGNKIETDQVFDGHTASMITNIAQANSVPDGYLIPLLLTATAHFMSGSTIKPCETWSEPGIIYAAVIGFPGSNKSRALSLFRQACERIEKAQGLDTDKSRLNQGATVESVLKELDLDRLQLALWDELRQFTSSFNAYKANGGDYDKSIYLSAFNGQTLKRQTCNKNRTIENPVLNICGMLHPETACGFLDKERTDCNDGLWARFHLILCEPYLPLMSEIKTLDQDKPSLERLLYTVSLMHGASGQGYTYTEQAMPHVEGFHDEQQLFLRKYHYNDSFISSITSKSKGQVHRLAMILQSLKNAQKLLNDCGLAKQEGLTEDFISSVTGYVDRNQFEFKVDDETTMNSIRLMKFFTQEKKYLAGFPKNHDPTASKTTSTGNTELLRKILLKNGPNVKTQDINRSCSKFNSASIKDAMMQLTDLGLGRTNHKAPTKGGVASFVFMKINFDELDIQEALAFTEKLSSLGISTADYKNAYCAQRNVLADKRDSDNIENAIPDKIQRLV